MLDATPAPLVLNPADNVAILTARAPQGARPLGLGEPLAAPVIASGHKIAREDDPRRQRHPKFGQIIGYATTPIAAGEHVHTQNCEFGAHDQEYHVGADLEVARAAIPQVAPRTFMGYRRDNGQVGTRNYIAVCATVNCSATVIRRAAEQVMSSGILADYPNVDGVVAFAHGTGCGMAASGPGFDNLQRVLWGHATHPNVGAAVFVGLGCEVMQVARMKAHFGAGTAPRFHGLTIQDTGGTTQDDRADRRADPRASAPGQRYLPRADPGLRAQGRAGMRRLGRLLRHHRQPGARRRFRPSCRPRRHGDPRRDPGDLRRRAAPAAPRRQSGGGAEADRAGFAGGRTIPRSTAARWTTTPRRATRRGA